MNAKQINERVAAPHTQAAGECKSNVLTAVNIGHPCERYLYMLLRAGNKRENGARTVYETPALNKVLFKYVHDKLRKAGYCAIGRHKWKLEEYGVAGGGVGGIADPDTGQAFPMRVVCLGASDWARLRCVEDCYASKKHYIRALPNPLLLYMWKYGVRKGFLLLANKMTGELKAIDVFTQAELTKALLKKARRIQVALACEKRPDKTAQAYICAQCRFAKQCAGSGR